MSRMGRGFPIGVIVLPILIPNASAINRTAGLNRKCFDICIASSIPSTAMVSFTKKADRIPNPTTNTSTILSGLLFALDNILNATNFKTPDLQELTLC
jgi:hypothetical protein